MNQKKLSSGHTHNCSVGIMEATWAGAAMGEGAATGQGSEGRGLEGRGSKGPVAAAVSRSRKRWPRPERNLRHDSNCLTSAQYFAPCSVHPEGTKMNMCDERKDLLVAAVSRADNRTHGCHRRREAIKVRTEIMSNWFSCCCGCRSGDNCHAAALALPHRHRFATAVLKALVPSDSPPFAEFVCRSSVMAHILALKIMLFFWQYQKNWFRDNVPNLQ